MGSNTKIRIIFDILAVLSIAIFPWWFTVVLVAVGFFLFRSFYEGFLFAVIVDSLYGAPRELFFGVSSVSFLFVFVLFMVVRSFKKRLRVL